MVLQSTATGISLLWDAWNSSSLNAGISLQELAKEEHVVPLSERFRMAYVSRAERIAAKAERNYQQKRRRQLRNDTVLQALARFKFL